GPAPPLSFEDGGLYRPLPAGLAPRLAPRQRYWDRPRLFCFGDRAVSAGGRARAGDPPADRRRDRMGRSTARGLAVARPAVPDRSSGWRSGDPCALEPAARARGAGKMRRTLGGNRVAVGAD